MRQSLSKALLLCSALGASSIWSAEAPASAATAAAAAATAGQESAQGNAPVTASDSAQAGNGRDSMATAAHQAAPGVELKSPLLAKLTLGGTVQLKGYYHNVSASRDADKSLSWQLRRLKLDMDGTTDGHFGFRGEFLLDGDNKDLGVDAGFLYWAYNDMFGIKGGKMKRPFSQEALASSGSLLTVERGSLYNAFLVNTVGHAGQDLGLMAYGGFVDDGRSVGYSMGIFNGKQSNDGTKGYAGQQYQGTDLGFKAKDVALRVNAVPMKGLNVEAAVSSKAADDMKDPNSYGYNVNTAYEVGLDYTCKHLRLLGEAAWGDNQHGVDSLIIKGSTQFFAFYAAAVWHEDYKNGRASEVIFKVEGLDPDVSNAKDASNDGKLRYTLGCNYFFTPRASILADYGVLQPFTLAVGEDKLTHDFDVMWRLSF